MIKFAIILALAMVLVPVVIEIGIEVLGFVVAAGLVAWAIWFMTSVYGLIFLGFAAGAAAILWFRDTLRARHLIGPPVHPGL